MRSLLTSATSDELLRQQKKSRCRSEIASTVMGEKEGRQRNEAVGRSTGKMAEQA